jgi:hypothetical protein
MAKELRDRRRRDLDGDGTAAAFDAGDIRHLALSFKSIRFRVHSASAAA